MSTHDFDNAKPLHLHTDPELERIESMLDALGQHERACMDEQAHSRVLSAVSGVLAPKSISIEDIPHRASAVGSRSWFTATRYRTAAAAILATAATLTIVVFQPWSSPDTQPQPAPNANANANAWSLASFEQDLDAYLALETLGTDRLDEAVADWELWAQTIDTEVDAMSLDHELLGDLNDGAI